MTRKRRAGWSAVLLLLLAARSESCGFTADENGLCAHLRLGPESDTLHVGDSFRVQVNADGCSAIAGCTCGQDALEGAEFTSDNPAVATIDSTGLVTGQRPGSTTIRAIPTGGSWSRNRVGVVVLR